MLFLNNLVPKDNLHFMYPILVSVGILSVIFASLIKFSLKRIPIIHLAHSLYFIVPIGLVGASILGKLGAYSTYEIWNYLAFWEPGMSIFGGFIAGFIAGFIYFLKISKKTKISILVYADLIIPNIFLGQSIGRWGNLFNHEILGKPTNGKLSWLPDFISSRLYYIYNPENGMKNQLPIIYREPLFLYESIACFIAWIVLTFLISNLVRIFSKKPWNLEPKDFPCIFNKKNKWINIEDLNFYNTQFPINYKYRKNNSEVSLSVKNVWNKAYYYYEPDRELIDKASYHNNLLKNKYYDNKSKYLNLKNKLKSEKKIYKNIKNSLSSEKIFLYKKNKIQPIKEEIKLTKNKINKLSYFLKHDSREIEQLHNPNRYLIIKCGVFSGLYFVFYSFIRMILEYHRTSYEMTIKWSITSNYILLLFILFIGLFVIWVSQKFLPYKIREKRWLYEKSY